MLLKKDITPQNQRSLTDRNLFTERKTYKRNIIKSVS